MAKRQFPEVQGVHIEGARGKPDTPFVDIEVSPSVFTLRASKLTEEIRFGIVYYCKHYEEDILRGFDLVNKFAIDCVDTRAREAEYQAALAEFTAGRRDTAPNRSDYNLANADGHWLVPTEMEVALNTTPQTLSLIHI